MTGITLLTLLLYGMLALAILAASVPLVATLAFGFSVIVILKFSLWLLIGLFLYLFDDVDFEWTLAAFLRAMLHFR